MNIIEPNHNGENLRIGIVQARFTNEVGNTSTNTHIFFFCNTIRGLRILDFAKIDKIIRTLYQ